MSHVNLFKTVRLRWFEIGVFKAGLLAAGVAVGAFCADFFMQYQPALVGIAAISLVYIAYVWMKQ